jgi:hypothetical protein
MVTGRTAAVPSRAREGWQLQLWFDPGKLHLFNPDNAVLLTL